MARARYAEEEELSITGKSSRVAGRRENRERMKGEEKPGGEQNEEVRGEGGLKI